MLADAEMQVAARERARLDVARSVKLERGLGRGVEIGGAANEPRVARPDRIEDLAAGLAGSKPVRVGREARHLGVPAGRQFAPLHRFELRGEAGMAAAIGFEPLSPLRVQFLPPLANSIAEVLVNPI